MHTPEHSLDTQRDSKPRHDSEIVLCIPVHALPVSYYCPAPSEIQTMVKDKAEFVCCKGAIWHGVILMQADKLMWFYEHFRKHLLMIKFYPDVMIESTEFFPWFSNEQKKSLFQRQHLQP